MRENCEKFTKHELENLFGLPYRKSKTKKNLCAELVANVVVKEGVNEAHLSHRQRKSNVERRK